MPRGQCTLLRTLVAALLAIALVACNDDQNDQGQQIATAATSPNTIQPGDGGEKGLIVSLLNYTDENIGPVYVDGDWAGNMGKHGGGTSFAGGAAVPAKWRRDYKLKISWSTDALFHQDPNKLYSRMVPLQPYGPHDGGILWVAFFPDDVIKLYVSAAGPGHPDFPAKIKYPFVQCWLDGFKDCPVAGKPESH